MGANITFEKVKLEVEASIKEFAREEKELLDIDVNERSISHKLAEYLQREFPDWDVDCEYNRKMGDKKTLNVSYDKVSDQDTEAKTVFPDIIVHHRKTEENLLVIEMKKHGKKTEKDAAKLVAFTGKEYQYGFGLLLVIGRDKALLSWYRHGELFKDQYSIDFEAAENGE